MSEPLHHPTKRGKFTLRVVYWVLGSISFLQLLAVGTILTLKFSERNSPPSSDPAGQITPNQAQQQAKQTPPSQLDDETLLEAIRPRSIEEMLGEADTANISPVAAIETGEQSPPQDQYPAPPSPSNQSASTPLPTERELLLSPHLAGLLKQSRYYQIEGDIKRSILKLEEAAAQEPNNPLVLYYFGLAYEAIRNTEKSREYFLKVVTMRQQAGKYFTLAAKHLETGFASPADRRGDIAFGTILEYREPDDGDGERVVLSIPILMKDGLNIRPQDLKITVNFFDISNNKKIQPTRAEKPQERWASAPFDGKDGEETLEIRYHMPPLTPEELTAYGDLKYYGYTAKLYYKGEPMDCHASPNVLFLIEQMNQTKSQDHLDYLDYGDPGGPGVLPPIDAEPAYKSNIMGDSSLLPP